MILIAELLSFLITLAAAQDLRSSLDDLAIVSLFVQWVALSCAAVLCAARRFLCGMGDTSAAILAYAIMIGVTYCISEAAWWVISPARDSLSIIASSHYQFVVRNLVVSALVSALALRYLYVQHHWKRRVHSESEARLQLLQSRIRPHFLFNCMNTIASLARTRPEASEQAVEDLADLFRASLTDARAQATLAEELDLAQRYLHIEALRLGSRLQTEWQIDDLPKNARLPTLSIQPLLENAVYHGIEPLPHGGRILITGHRQGRQLHISIENPISRNPGQRARAGNQLAQDNVRQRLQAFYGKGGDLAVETDESKYRVCLSIPYESETYVSGSASSR